MTESRRPNTGQQRWALVAGVGFLVLFALQIDRSSIERGNRLFRAGELVPAAELFLDRAEEEAPDPEAVYNSGTAQLALGDAGAEIYLLQAAAGPDSAAAQRANYNLGYLYIAGVRDEMEPDSAVFLLERSISRSRAALRLDPAHENSRWNLALAQLRLDSVQQIRINKEQRSLPGNDETPVDLEALVRGVGEARSGIEPENARASEVLGTRLAASQGAREAWASQDPGPITEAAARRLLESVAHDPERLIRGLMWSHRPDVAWWNSEPYPGGNW